MIGTSSVVVVDACVLYPAGLRSLMMWLALHEAIRPKWTEQIHEEWMRNVLKDHPDITLEQLERTRRLMDLHAGDCLVQNYEKHIKKIELPDPDDRHVVAAAIEATADAIVTWNVVDFPQPTLAYLGIDVRMPDQLLVELLEANRDSVIEAMREHRQSLKNPPKSSKQYLENLEQQGLADSLKLLKPYLQSI